MHGSMNIEIRVVLFTLRCIWKQKTI